MIALLRAINVAGNKMVAMSDLRDLLTQLGFANARSFLQSGNLTFDAPRSSKNLEQLLEKESARRLGLETVFFVRTPAEWDAIIEKNPFRKEAKDDPGRLVVLFLKDARDGATLQKAIKGREVARGEGRQIYVYYPDGQGRSKLTNALIEKTLATRATARNWNTVLKLGRADDASL
jgi:uncharacterized protein (DUF1697 family)